jgi:hypothetical protein
MEVSAAQRRAWGTGGSGNDSPAAEKPFSQAPDKKDTDEKSVLHGFADVGLDEPVVVDDAGDGGDVDGAMQNLPAAAAKAANRSGGGSERKGNQEDEAEKTHGDEGALEHILPHGGKAEGLIRADVSEKVQANIEKGEKTEHAAQANEFRKFEDLSQRGNGKRDDKEAESPIACAVLKSFDGIGAEITCKRAPAEQKKGHEAHHEQKGFGPFADEEFAHAARVS